MIRFTAIFAVCLLIFFAYWEWNHPDPIVDLKLLKNRNFGTAVFLQLILGMVLFGSTVLIPQYVQVLLGYTAERAGMVISPAAFVMMFMMFVAGRTVGKMDPRLMVCIAYVVTALGVFNLSQLDLTSKMHNDLRKTFRQKHQSANQGQQRCADNRQATGKQQRPA